MGNFYYDRFWVFTKMLPVIGLHFGISPYGYPSCLDQIPPQDRLAPWGNTKATFAVATVVHSRHQADIATQLFLVVKSSQITKFGNNGRGKVATDSRYTFQ